MIHKNLTGQDFEVKNSIISRTLRDIRMFIKNFTSIDRNILQSLFREDLRWSKCIPGDFVHKKWNTQYFSKLFSPKFIKLLPLNIC